MGENHDVPQRQNGGQLAFRHRRRRGWVFRHRTGLRHALLLAPDTSTQALKLWEKQYPAGIYYRAGAAVQDGQRNPILLPIPAQISQLRWPPYAALSRLILKRPRETRGLPPRQACPMLSPGPAGGAIVERAPPGDEHDQPPRIHRTDGEQFRIRIERLGAIASEENRLLRERRTGADTLRHRCRRSCSHGARLGDVAGERTIRMAAPLAALFLCDIQQRATGWRRRAEGRHPQPERVRARSGNGQAFASRRSSGFAVAADPHERGPRRASSCSPPSTIRAASPFTGSTPTARSARWSTSPRSSTPASTPIRCLPCPRTDR